MVNKKLFQMQVFDAAKWLQNDCSPSVQTIFNIISYPVYASNCNAEESWTLYIYKTF